MKKFLGLILIAIVGAFCVASLFACDGYYFGDRYTLSEDGQSYSLDNMNAKSDVDYVIPSEHKGLPVTALGSSALSPCSNMVSITFPASITKVGADAFAGCTEVESVYVSDIGAWAGISFTSEQSNPPFYAKKLYNNNELVTELDLPDTVKSIGTCAFIGYSELTKVTLPASVEEIGNSAFCGCGNLQSVNMSEAVQSIGCYAFSKCEKLRSVIIPDSVTEIRCDAFSLCHGLVSVTIGKNVEYIEGDAFEECLKLIEVYNRSALDIVAGSYGYGAVGANALEIQTSDFKSKLSLDDNGFLTVFDNTGLFITGVERGLVAYYGTETDVVIPDNIQLLTRGVFFNEKITSVVVPSSVIIIDRYAFTGCSELQSVTLPEGLQAILTGGFSLCKSLTEITIPNSVTEIGDSAFYECDSLRTISIPDGVTKIKSMTFKSCSALTSVTIPASVTDIGYDAFNYCEALTEFNYGGTYEQWGAIHKGSWWKDLTQRVNLICTDSEHSV